MRIAKIQLAGGGYGVGLVERDMITPLALSPKTATLFEILEMPNPAEAVELMVERRATPLAIDKSALVAPIDRQEVWGAGVTYKRSRAARMEESEGAANFYDLVYAAPRPELFFKASPHRVAGPGQGVRIRRDSNWNVPEPELVLVLNSRLELVGYTVGNDMSSRDIEGENPLYLPQAKVYDGCCALGPWITLAAAMPPREQIGIRLTVQRGDSTAFAGATSVEEMARTFDDLISWLARDNSFPQGVFLFTGTGIVPPGDFTLMPGDWVEIAIDGIGTLRNPVVRV